MTVSMLGRRRITLFLFNEVSVKVPSHERPEESTQQYDNIVTLYARKGRPRFMVNRRKPYVYGEYKVEPTKCV